MFQLMLFNEPHQVQATLVPVNEVIFESGLYSYEVLI